MFVYLDNSATTKPLEAVTTEMVNCLTTDFGNPSSLHKLGVNAEKKLKLARTKIAKTLKVEPNEIIFTSGGTEADNIAILGAVKALKRKGKKIITSQIEHSAVTNTFKYLETQGYEVHYLSVDGYGNIDLQELDQAMDDKTVLVSIMHVNNEIGIIAPIEEIGKIVSRYDNAIFHTDAVQSYTKVNIKPKNCNIDMLSISAHKLHGPKGAGLLYIDSKCRIEPSVFGGGQESNLRSGTQNVPGISGLGTAAEMAFKTIEDDIKSIKELKAYFIEKVKNNIDDIKINSYEDERCAPHIVNISFLGIRGEVLLHMLEEKSIYVSTGSACSSKSKAKSGVLNAINLKDIEIEGAIRFSFSKFNTTEEIDYAIEHLIKSVAFIRKVVKR